METVLQGSENDLPHEDLGKQPGGGQRVVSAVLLPVAHGHLCIRSARWR